MAQSAPAHRSSFFPQPGQGQAARKYIYLPLKLNTLLTTTPQRLLESSLRWLIYLSRTPRQQKTTRTILITLISLSAIQRTLPLIPLTISVTLLDNLSLLRSPPKLLSTATNLANLALNILHYARSSLDKAALWHLGRSTRQALADTEQSIRHNKRLLRTTHDHPPQPPLLLEQIAADTRLNRARKASLKHSKHALHRLGWARIVYAIDALVSAYDLLELKYCSRGLRMLIESTSALLEAAYGHALQSLSPSTTPP
ncbi:hypothetical protein PtB15_18B26 [Puccinia triticina]|nr:hypothetical protein PtB15_18B26 [Puccinia triticina]